MKQFSKLSIDLTKKLSKDIKKDNGIFFTPFDIIRTSIEELKKLQLTSIRNILEPSCGSCQFIISMDEDTDNYFKDISFTCIENNKLIYDNIKEIELKNNSVEFINESYLDFDVNHINKYDLIIGNPPYYVITDNDKKKKSDKTYYDGRPNIFILFIIHSLKKLNENGILLFILPKNFLNCLYYNKLRKHIYDNYGIINIIDCSKCNYIDTEQETIIFIIQNIKRNNDDYSISINNNTIFNTPNNIIKIKEFYGNSVSLNELNFEVKVGSVVWNQNKSLLTDDDSKTRLIYSSDIKNNSLILNKYKNDDKKNYIDKKGNNELLLVVNRGYGKGNYKFNYCIIDVPFDYLIENHLIVIKYKNEINKDDLMELYKKITESFLNEKTNEFINIYFGNNAINTNELQYILPIFS